MITGLAVGMESVVIPVLGIAAIIYCSTEFADCTGWVLQPLVCWQPSA